MKKRMVVLRKSAKVVLLLSFITGWAVIHGCGRKESGRSSMNETERGPAEATIPVKGGEKMVVKEGDKVKVQYTGKLENDTVFDKSKPEDPLEFTVGSGQIIPGFDEAVRGMKLDEEKTVTVEPEDAYGNRDDSLIRDFPKSSLPEDFQAEKGMVIRLQDQNGRDIPGTITNIGEENLTIDLNHPLAGQDLVFDITVVGIE